jgi:DNA-directed RNA polymerase specialized sigma24 family protein
VDAHIVFMAILAKVLEGLEHSFRMVRNHHDKEDLMQEALGMVWKWTLRMLKRDKDPREFPSAVAGYAAKNVKSGRRVAGGSTGKNDPLCRIAQGRHGFRLEVLPTIRELTPGQREQDSFEEQLQDNTRSPVPDQVAFRIDFPQWLTTHTARSRDVMDAMMEGNCTTELAEAFGLTPGRISQMRRAFEHSWRIFIGELKKELTDGEEETGRERGGRPGRRQGGRAAPGESTRGPAGPARQGRARSDQ